ncbi:DUF4236 domain-containing protein [Streptomyces sp. NPDC059063]|uniref:DUF4236 domain-containing protein n=1 Tax=unclassified Streptomyces TaxID=2593676 RepID=UPI003699AE62
MSLTFHKSFRIFPGVRVNINGRSWSITVGGRRGQHTVNSDGRRSTSVDVAGFSWRSNRRH